MLSIWIYRRLSISTNKCYLRDPYSGIIFDYVMSSWKWKWSCSVVSDSFRLHGLWPTRLLHPWGFPGKNTGVGCHFLLQGNLPHPGIEPRSPTLQADALPSEPPRKPMFFLCGTWGFKFSFHFLGLFFVSLKSNTSLNLCVNDTFQIVDSIWIKN